MPKVPQYNLKPLKSLYNPGEGFATMKQKSLIITLHERRKLHPPDLSKISKREATWLIDSMLNPR